MLKEMAYAGYGYTRSGIRNMATDYGVHLGKRAKQEKVLNWFYFQMVRTSVIKPSRLLEQHAKRASEELLKNYFEELNNIKKNMFLSQPTSNNAHMYII